MKDRPETKVVKTESGKARTYQNRQILDSCVYMCDMREILLILVRYIRGLLKPDAEKTKTKRGLCDMLGRYKYVLISVQDKPLVTDRWTCTVAIVMIDNRRERWEIGIVTIAG